MTNINASKIVDFRKAKTARQKKLSGWYLGHRDLGFESRRSVRSPGKPHLRELPLIGPNRLPPEYLAA